MKTTTTAANVAVNTTKPGSCSPSPAPSRSPTPLPEDTINDQPSVVDHQHELARCEAIIDQAFDQVFEAGQALLKIRDQRLYRATHETFEEYCQARFAIQRSHAHRWIQAAQVFGNLSPIGDGPRPLNEAQVRPLARLKPDQQRRAWERACKSVPTGNVTAEVVAKAVQNLYPPKTKKTSVEKAEALHTSKVQTVQAIALGAEPTGDGIVEFALADDSRFRIPIPGASPSWKEKIRFKCDELARQSLVSTPVVKERACGQQRLLLTISSAINAEFADQHGAQAVSDIMAVLTMLQASVQPDNDTSQACSSGTARATATDATMTAEAATVEKEAA